MIFRICFLVLMTTCFTTAFSQKNFLDQPYLETSAKADTLVSPDRISLSILINESDTKNRKSVEELERLLESSLRSLSIDTEKDLTLLDFSSDFKKYFLRGQNVVKSKQYILIVRDANTAGRVLSKLEEVGISNVNIESLEYTNWEKMILELKAIAIAKTKVTAVKLTETANQKLGRIIFISDDKTTFAGNFLAGSAAGIVIRGSSSLYGSRAAEPIATEFKKIKLTAEVSVKYMID